MRSRVVCAYAVLDGLYGLLFGIVPFYCKTSPGKGVPWSVIRDVEFLDFLDVMIFFGIVHSSGTVISLVNVGGYYFHAKSRMRHITGIITMVAQNATLPSRWGRIPWYSRENPRRGATKA